MARDWCSLSLFRRIWQEMTITSRMILLLQGRNCSLFMASTFGGVKVEDKLCFWDTWIVGTFVMFRRAWLFRCLLYESEKGSICTH
jgi:hypothetical protein